MEQPIRALADNHYSTQAEDQKVLLDSLRDEIIGHDCTFTLMV